MVKIRERESINQVQREIGYLVGNISSCCNGRYKQAYGYIRRFVLENYINENE